MYGPRLVANTFYERYEKDGLVNKLTVHSGSSSSLPTLTNKWNKTEIPVAGQHPRLLEEIAEWLEVLCLCEALGRRLSGAECHVLEVVTEDSVRTATLCKGPCEAFLFGLCSKEKSIFKYQSSFFFIRFFFMFEILEQNFMDLWVCIFFQGHNSQPLSDSSGDPEPKKRKQLPV